MFTSVKNVAQDGTKKQVKSIKNNNLNNKKNKRKNNMEDTIRKLTDGMNEAISEANTRFVLKKGDHPHKRYITLKACVKILQCIDTLCDIFKVEMPDEAINANVHLDEYFECDVLSVKFV